MFGVIISKFMCGWKDGRCTVYIMNTKLATAQIRVKNWAAIIQERNESGLSVKDYCAQHQLS